MIPINLNLGCGQYPKEGYLNIDMDPESKADRFMDLSEFPYDLPNNHFELVEADHIFEHLDDQMQVMREIHRLLKPGGILHFRTPHFSRGFTHWQHRRGFDVSYPLYFQKEFLEGYVGIEFILKKMEFHWFAQPYLKKKVLSTFQYLAGWTLGKVFDFLSSLSPYACSRIWCFWVGGFEEVEFIFQKPEF
jgi:predicted SAM-dependent methyltransferase